MITRISQILPLQKFTDICRKVYFAVEEYKEVDFILANAYLKYVFAEHIVVFGRQDYREPGILPTLWRQPPRCSVATPTTLASIYGGYCGADTWSKQSHRMERGEN
jgi:hypothetical protein